ncbi:MAG: hypothetical protein HUJ98_07670, partial [Bacteroidaceae bacterium]|nr:hypothetical protein [Bacteroidaceae bacterium]
MKKIYYIPALLAGMLSLASCNDNEPGGGNTPVNPQEGINFNIGLESASSRTHYADNDWLQIEWNPNDQVTIACAQTQAPTSEGKWASKTSANYTVTDVLPNTQEITIDGVKQEVTTDSKAKIAVKAGETALYWGDNDENDKPIDHTFYAGYGENIKIDPNSGIARCMYDPEQILEYDEDTETWINMSQAYMVASKVTKPVDNVDLHFKPIMTTLEVDVHGLAQQSSGNITITAIEITVPKDQDKISTIISPSSPTPYAYFEYDIKNTDKDEACPTVSSPKEEKMIFTLKTPKTVSAGQIVKITAILPPIIIDDENPLIITVDAKDGSKTAKFASGVATSAKAVIQTKDWTPITTPVEGVDYVDLGLPSHTKWATCNLGASEPHESGDHFGWGCTIPYATSAYVGEDEGDLSLYFRKIGGTGSSIRDCGTEKDPLKNKANIACTEYDAAHVRLGGGDWHMPTQANIYELIVNCNWEWTNDYNGKGVKGYIVTSKNNNNSIFLPFAGRRESTDHRDLNAGGYYWNSTPSSINAYEACRILLDDANHIWSSFRRYNGHSIRPVYGEIKTEETVDFELPSGLLWATCNVGASTPGEYGDYYGWGCTIPYTDNENAYWELYFQKIGGTGTAQGDCGTDKDPLKDFVYPNSKSISGTNYDVAHVRLGDKWRMPTADEWQELTDHCTWTVADYGGVSGYLVTGETSKGTVEIFLPAGGFRYK